MRDAAALLVDTLRLTGDSPREMLQQRWSTTDLRGLGRLVTFEGAGAWLARRLHALGITLPDEFRVELRAMVRQASVINMRIDAQTVAVLTRLRAASIPVAFIKGQARRAATQLYPYADARQLSDVDLLVPESRADEAWQLLCQHGFRRVYDDNQTWTADHHRPVLTDANEVVVELHTTTAMSVSATESWRRATELPDCVEWNGVATSVPNATELVWQALSHGVADGVRGYYLKGFLGVAAILAQSPIIDWTRIAERMQANEVCDNATQQPVSRERLRRWLGVAASLAGTPIPATLTPKSPGDVVGLLAWRGRVLGSALRWAVQERLLEEGLRAEALMPLTPAIARSGALHAARRRTSSLVARAAYIAARVARAA